MSTNDTSSCRKFIKSNFKHKSKEKDWEGEELTIGWWSRAIKFLTKNEIKEFMNNSRSE